MSFLLFLFMNLSNDQSLNGKWLMVKNSDTYIVPTIPIIEFKEGKTSLYDFDKIQKTEEKIVKDNFFFIDENRLKHNSDDIEIYYVRLLPTETGLSDKEIEELKFDFSWNNEKVKVAFNQELSLPGMTEIMRTEEVQKIRLERIESTLFISFYNLGKRQAVLPIKKVTSKSLEVFGFYKAPFYVTSN